MILRTAFKPASFVNAVEATIAGGERFRRRTDEDLIAREFIYLVGGHWRAHLIWDTSGAELNLIGVKLLNPDRTSEEIRRVEQGVAILRHLEWSA